MLQFICFFQNIRIDILRTDGWSWRVAWAGWSFNLISQQQMIKCIFPTHPLVLLYFKTFEHEVFRNRADWWMKWRFFRVNSIEKLKFIRCRPWSSPMKHFIINQSDGPKIRLICVLCFFEQLRRHVKRSANYRFHDGVLIFQVFCESKIADFALTIFHKNICRLKITMDDSIGMEVLDALHDLFQVDIGFLLLDFAFFL